MIGHARYDRITLIVQESVFEKGNCCCVHTMKMDPQDTKLRMQLTSPRHTCTARVVCVIGIGTGRGAALGTKKC